MKKQLFCLFILGFFSSAFAAPNNYFIDKAKPAHIFVNNRILARVNGKAISVIDLTKKMDLLFYRQYPHYASSIEARFQFYEMSWRPVLREMIDKELILADAVENKLPVSQGDIRQEIENLFGPNIIDNLDKAGLTYEEAKEMIKSDLIIKRMLGAKVHAKGARSVTPQMVHEEYLKWAEENTKPEVWRYRVISIRGDDDAKSCIYAQAAYDLLTKKGVSIDSLNEKLSLDSNTTLTISQEFEHEPGQISENYRTILSTLAPDSFSPPTFQKGRDKKEVYRIFYLGTPEEQEIAALHQVELNIREKMIGNAIEKESIEYLAKLRKHHELDIESIEQAIPSDFQPFALK